ncbi:MAG: N-acetyl-gamma-glutamyl-phosphate reductase [Byssovorax sp.]
MTMFSRKTIGLIGARGYVGQELMSLLARHPGFEVAFVSSRTTAGEPVPGVPGLVFEDLDAAAIAARRPDALVLALPNDLSHPIVEAIDAAHPETVIVDVSADHRFDAAWVYGLPEHHRAQIRGHRRIANPGCYATATALAVRPLAGLLAGPAHAFGVSGYSGAGTTPSPRNDVEALRDNLMPYALTGHLHEREVTRHAAPVCFVPHVAPFFRGITVTVSMMFDRPVSKDELAMRLTEAYAGEPLVSVVEGIPLVRAIAGKPGAALGGVSADEARRHGVVVSTLDNLLKGAAGQAVQNLNLAFGFPEMEGILPWPSP